MSENLELEKQLKLVAKTGSYVVGRREVSNSLKGTKLLVWSASANVPQLILDECKNLSVPAIKFTGNPVELGRACGIPFRVSVIALKSAGDADLSGFTKASDYFSGVTITTPKQPERVESKPAKEESGTKSKKKETVKTEKTKKAKSEAGEEEIVETKKKKSDTGKTSSKKEPSDETKQKKTTRKKKKSTDEEEREED